MEKEAGEAPIAQVAVPFPGLALLRSLADDQAGLTDESLARCRPWCPPRSAFAGYRFPAEVIMVAVRWYLRYALSYRDVEELLLNAASRSTTSRSTDGCSGSPHCWPTPPDSSVTHQATGGSSTRPT
jgi:hypothetical protein